MFRGRVKGIKKVIAKGRPYFYHRKSMKRIKAPFGTAEFVLEVARIEHAVKQKGAVPGTVGMLIDAYRTSHFWADLRPSTRISYDRAFEVLGPLRPMPLIEFKPAWVAGCATKLVRSVDDGWRTTSEPSFPFWPNSVAKRSC